MGHDHDHGISPSADGRWLWAALGLLSAFMVGEVAVAVASGSLALLSDAGHMLTDAGAIGAALWALRLAQRPAAGAWTFGWKRAEILSALGNGATMLVVAVLVAVEAVRRLADTRPHVDGGPVLVVALVGVVVNVLATLLLARANRSSLNVEGAYQHLLTDVFGFVGTAIAAVVILATGWMPADAIASLVVVGLMLRAAWGLLRDSGRILLEAAPSGIDLTDLRDHIAEVEHVVDVHDLHAWTVTSGLPAVSAHVVVDDDCFHDGHVPELLDRMQACLGDHFDVEHSTFQFERAAHAEHEHGTHA